MPALSQAIASLSYARLFIGMAALVLTAGFFGGFSSRGLFVGRSVAFRLIVANLAGTASSLMFAFADHTHPRSPPDAYWIGAAQCGLFICLVVVGKLALDFRTRGAK